MPKTNSALADPEDEGSTPKLSKRGAIPRPATGEKRIRIVLEENENIPPTGQFFSVNGRSWMLRPGEEADVPVEIINVLNDAVMDTPTVDTSTNQVVGYRKKLRFPYRVIVAQ